MRQINMNPHWQRTTGVDDNDDDEGWFPVCSNTSECPRDTEMPVG